MRNGCRISCRCHFAVMFSSRFDLGAAADLAYRYGRVGSLVGMRFDPVQGMLASGSFGTAAQTLQSAAALDTGLRRLA